MGRLEDRSGLSYLGIPEQSSPGTNYVKEGRLALLPRPPTGKGKREELERGPSMMYSSCTRQGCSGCARIPTKSK